MYEEQDQFPDRHAQFQPSNLSTRESEAEFYADERDVDRDDEEIVEMETDAGDVGPESNESAVNRNADDILSDQQDVEQDKGDVGEGDADDMDFTKVK